MSELSRYQDTPIGPYRLTRLIGVGPVSRVYLSKRADWPANPVALKLFETVPIHDPEEQDAILDEARLLACMEHPAILPVLDDGLHEKMLYLTTPYIEEGSLRQLMTTAAGELLPMSRALMIIQQVGEALQFAHAQQIVHANLKPENILFQNDEQILLGDFLLPGLVKSERAARILSSFAALYMAPEQFRGIATPLSDQYALACLAYELLTGRPPFEADDGMSLARQHATREPEPPSQIQPLCTPQIDLALLKALVKRPEGRYPDVRTFLAELKLAPAPVEVATQPEVAPVAAPPVATAMPVPTVPEKAILPVLLPLAPVQTGVADLETIKQPIPQGISLAVKTGIHEAVMMARRGIRAKAPTSAQPQLAPAVVPSSQMLVPVQPQPAARKTRRQVWLVTAITLLALVVSISSITLFFNAAATRHDPPQPQVHIKQTATAPATVTSATPVVSTATAATSSQPTATATSATTPTPTATPVSKPTPTPTLRPTPTATPTPTPTPSPTPTAASLQCRVSYKVTGQWPGGFLAAVTVTNTGSASIQDWKLTFTFPGTQYIINGWGGSFKQSGSQVSVTSSYSSQDLSAGASISLGFQASVYGPNNAPARFSLNGVACA